MLIKRAQFLISQQGFTAKVAPTQQPIDTAVLSAFEIGAHRVKIHQRHIGDVLHTTTLLPMPEKDDPIDAVGFANLAHLAVHSPQLGQLLLAQSLITHPPNLTTFFGK